MKAGLMVARVLGGLAAAPLLVGLTAAPALALSNSAAPPGNNGTIKVDGQPFDQGHDNEPHPGCTFRLTFFGFDAGSNTATITFDAHPPTGSAELQRETFTFTDTRDHGGATFDAATPAYDLSQALSRFGAVKQGYHVKVSVSVNGGHAKHKVFWIDSCAKAAAAAAAPSSPAPAARQPVATAPAASAPAASAPAASAGMALVAPVAGTAAAPAAEAATITASPGEAVTAAYVGAPSPETSGASQVLGETVTRAASAPASTRSGLLAFTGFNVVVWSLAGLVAVGLGLGLRRFGRRPVPVG